MENRATTLRPRGYGEILDATFDLYKSNFLLLVGISGIVYIPLAVCQAALASVGGSAVGAAMIVLMLVTVLFAIFVNGAMTKAVSDVYLGAEASVTESYGYVLRRWLPYIWTNILCVLLVYAGIILCVIPGIVFAFWIVFASEVFVIEGRAGWKAIERSRDLIGGQCGRVFVLMFLVGILAAVLQAVPVVVLQSVLGDSAAGDVLAAAWQGLANTVVIPIQMIALILLYYDIRIRKEAFDLEVLAESMADWGGDRGTAAPAEELPLAAAPAPDVGAVAPQPTTCASCGSQLPEGAAFCEQCGQRVAQAAP